MTSITEFADGLVLTADDFDGEAPTEQDVEVIINKVMELAEADGVKLEGGGRDMGSQSFHIAGEVFTYTEDGDDLLIEALE